MNNETLATELLKEAKVNAKRWFIIAMVILGMWLATITGFIVYLSLPEEVTQTTVDQQTDGGGDNQIVGGDYYNDPAENNADNNPTEQAP